MVGYYYEEEIVINKGEVVKIKKYEYVNFILLIFVFKNRLFYKYRDKVE